MAGRVREVFETPEPRREQILANFLKFKGIAEGTMYVLPKERLKELCKKLCIRSNVDGISSLLGRIGLELYTSDQLLPHLGNLFAKRGDLTEDEALVIKLLTGSAILLSDRFGKKPIRFGTDALVRSEGVIPAASTEPSPEKVASIIGPPFSGTGVRDTVVLRISEKPNFDSGETRFALDFRFMAQDFETDLLVARRISASDGQQKSREKELSGDGVRAGFLRSLGKLGSVG